MTGNVRWPLVCRRGAVVAIVAASHVALFLWVVTPPRPRPRGHRVTRSTPARIVLQVTLIEPSHPSVIPATPKRITNASTRAKNHSPRHFIQPPQTARAAPPQHTAAAATANTTTSTTPAFVAGGGFNARLRAAGTATPTTPKLPGGHHYLASDFKFVPVEQQSIEAKVHKVAGYLFGGFDPTCKNAQLELTKSRAQQIADGYTPEDLKRLVREHCR